MKKGCSSWIGLGVVVLGLLFMGIGVVRGEMNTVFSKAVQICLECIGIG